jgi:hypothetical protein
VTGAEHGRSQIRGLVVPFDKPPVVCPLSRSIFTQLTEIGVIAQSVLLSNVERSLIRCGHLGKRDGRNDPQSLEEETVLA